MCDAAIGAAAALAATQLITGVALIYFVLRARKAQRLYLHAQKLPVPQHQPALLQSPSPPIRSPAPHEQEDPAAASIPSARRAAWQLSQQEGPVAPSAASVSCQTDAVTVSHAASQTILLNTEHLQPPGTVTPPSPNPVTPLPLPTHRSRRTSEIIVTEDPNATADAQAQTLLLASDVAVRPSVHAWTCTAPPPASVQTAAQTEPRALESAACQTDPGIRNTTASSCQTDVVQTAFSEVQTTPSDHVTHAHVQTEPSGIDAASQVLDLIPISHAQTQTHVEVQHTGVQSQVVVQSHVAVGDFEIELPSQAVQASCFGVNVAVETTPPAVTACGSQTDPFEPQPATPSDVDVVQACMDWQQPVLAGLSVLTAVSRSPIEVWPAYPAHVMTLLQQLLTLPLADAEPIVVAALSLVRTLMANQPCQQAWLQSSAGADTLLTLLTLLQASHAADATHVTTAALDILAQCAPLKLQPVSVDIWRSLLHLYHQEPSSQFLHVLDCVMSNVVQPDSTLKTLAEAQHCLALISPWSSEPSSHALVCCRRAAHIAAKLAGVSSVDPAAQPAATDLDHIQVTVHTLAHTAAHSALCAPTGIAQQAFLSFLRAFVPQLPPAACSKLFAFVLDRAADTTAPQFMGLLEALFIIEDLYHAKPSLLAARTADGVLSAAVPRLLGSANAGWRFALGTRLLTQLNDLAVLEDECMQLAQVLLQTPNPSHCWLIGQGVMPSTTPGDRLTGTDVEAVAAAVSRRLHAQHAAHADPPTPNETKLELQLVPDEQDTEEEPHSFLHLVISLETAVHGADWTSADNSSRLAAGLDGIIAGLKAPQVDAGQRSALLQDPEVSRVLTRVATLLLDACARRVVDGSVVDKFAVLLILCCSAAELRNKLLDAGCLDKTVVVFGDSVQQLAAATEDAPDASHFIGVTSVLLRVIGAFCYDGQSVRRAVQKGCVHSLLVAIQQSCLSNSVVKDALELLENCCSADRSAADQALGSAVGLHAFMTCLKNAASKRSTAMTQKCALLLHQVTPTHVDKLVVKPGLADEDVLRIVNTAVEVCGASSGVAAASNAALSIIRLIATSLAKAPPKAAFEHTVRALVGQPCAAAILSSLGVQPGAVATLKADACIAAAGACEAITTLFVARGRTPSQACVVTHLIPVWIDCIRCMAPESWLQQAPIPWQPLPWYGQLQVACTATSRPRTLAAMLKTTASALACLSTGAAEAVTGLRALQMTAGSVGLLVSLWPTEAGVDTVADTIPACITTITGLPASTVQAGLRSLKEPRADASPADRAASLEFELLLSATNAWCAQGFAPCAIAVLAHLSAGLGHWHGLADDWRLALAVKACLEASVSPAQVQRNQALMTWPWFWQSAASGAQPPPGLWSSVTMITRHVVQQVSANAALAPREQASFLGLTAPGNRRVAVLAMLEVVLRQCPDTLFLSDQLFGAEFWQALAPSLQWFTWEVAMVCSATDWDRDERLLVITRLLGTAGQRLFSTGIADESVVYDARLTRLLTNPPQRAAWLVTEKLDTEFSSVTSDTKVTEAAPKPAALRLLYRRWPAVFHVQIKAAGLKCTLRPPPVPGSRQRVTEDVLVVSRSNLFISAFTEFRKRPRATLRQPWRVTFEGEETVIDIYGVRREFVTLVSREMVAAETKLFQAGADRKFLPLASALSDTSLQQFEFVGRLLGRACMEGLVLDVSFSPLVIKRLLGHRPSMLDLRTVDPDLFQQATWIRDHDITNVLFLTFAVERVGPDGSVSAIDLCPGGSTRDVTNANKSEYLDMLVKYHLESQYEAQLQALCRGFADVVDSDALRGFSDTEFEQVVCGIPQLDIDDLVAHWTFKNGYSADSPQVQWLAAALRTYDHAAKSAFMMFVTGASRCPPGGFGGLDPPFTVQKVDDPRQLPSASTCFNLLKLPAYNSQQELKRALNTSVTEGTTGFAFA